MPGLFAPTLLRTIMSRKMTSIATTKRNWPILRKVRDVTLTYSVNMQERRDKKAILGCQNDRAARANIVGYHIHQLRDFHGHHGA